MPGLFNHRNNGTRNKNPADRLKLFRNEGGGGGDNFATAGSLGRISPSRLGVSVSVEQCCAEILSFCQQNDIPAHGELIFRFACFHSFDTEAACKAIAKQHHSRYLHLRIDPILIRQLQSGIIFPIPSLKTRNENAAVLYVRPCLYQPSTENSLNFIDAMCYVLNDMSKTREQCENGVAVIMNMSGYSKANFHRENSKRVLSVFQGRKVPTKIPLILMVDPSKIAFQVWKIVRPMAPASLAKKMHFITNDKLGRYFGKDYQFHLPEELASGCVSSAEITEDYIDLKLVSDQEHQ